MIARTPVIAYNRNVPENGAKWEKEHFMQFIQDENGQKNRRIAVLVAVGLVVLLLAVLYLTGVLGGGTRRVSAVKLRCDPMQDIKPFGNTVLFYDGTSLVCLNSNGSEKWSYIVGSNASFDAGDNAIVVWAGTQLSILDANGRSTYDNNLGDTIQFARMGSRYVAVVLGDDSTSEGESTLLIIDHQGNEKDKETSAYDDMLILDVGFFSDGEYLWTTAMDLYGTVPSTQLNTYKVDAMNTGSTDLGETITYKVIYAGNQLNVIGTRQIRVYDYRGTQDTSGTVLVYGWQLIDSMDGSTAQFLFAPTRQTTDLVEITELRYLSGKTDKRFTLPDTCVGAAFYNRKIYAFSSNSIYRADLSAQRFSAVSLPIDEEITGYIGMLSNGTAILSGDTGVYAVSLP